MKPFIGYVNRSSLWSVRQQEDERLRLEAQRGGLELQGLQSHEVPWPQERAMLQQEVRLFRRNTIIFYMKLRWILMHWRLGRKDDSGEEPVHPEVSPGCNRWGRAKRGPVSGCCLSQTLGTRWRKWQHTVTHPESLWGVSHQDAGTSAGLIDSLFHRVAPFVAQLVDLALDASLLLLLVD